MSEGFKRPIYWKKYKVFPNKIYDENDVIKELLDASYQGVKRLFVLAYRDRGGANRVKADSQKRYFLPRVKIKNRNIEIDGRNFYDQPINDLIMMKSDKYRQDKVMITQLVVCWILLILKKITD